MGQLEHTKPLILTWHTHCFKILVRRAKEKGLSANDNKATSYELPVWAGNPLHRQPSMHKDGRTAWRRNHFRYKSQTIRQMPDMENKARRIQTASEVRSLRVFRHYSPQRFRLAPCQRMPIERTMKGEEQ